MGFAAFVYVTFEVFAVGLIAPMARDLGVTEGSIGLLMTVYAGIVALITIPAMHYTRRIDRKPLYMATLVFLLAGVVLQAVAPTYAVLVIARVIAALTHGLFWSLVNPMAARLGGEGHTGQAVAVVSLGSTMALVLGSPAVTFIGGLIGWRGATWALGALVVVSFLVLMATLPAMPAILPEQAAAKQTRSAIPSLILFLGLAVTALFTTYTYLGLIVNTTSGPAWVPFGLALYGLIGIPGVLWAGRRVDRRMIRLNVVPTILMVLASSLGLFALSIHGPAATASTVAMISVLGLAAGALPTVATTIFLFAGGPNQDRASAIYVVTFQVGIASGSALGALAVDGGVLAGTLALTALLASAAGLVMALWSRPILR
ncbi:MFS transporter [Corynebacterium liangguodongii]|uniref:MFS transporter n=1 Tax=Corynebacterium liangguodongii TaxID=2079535 RepID=A0A2S0WHB9_9CORY|nr:MFS transporter [Corynebacterium liangguodongii]AWB85177.1 MFS transporter [Corynebacterium liangguodongii]PWB99422.1 MFS transporter [Corynebacterium liangguodongii]